MTETLQTQLIKRWSAGDPPYCQHRAVTLTPNGLELGAEMLLLPLHDDQWLDIGAHAPRLACLLSACYDRVLAAETIGIFQKAADSYAKYRNPTLAYIVLSWAQLPRLDGSSPDTDAALWRMFAANEMLKMGVPPEDILDAWNLLPDGVPREGWQNWVKSGFNPDQPRDDHGRWCAAWGTALSEQEIKDRAKKHGGWLAPSDVRRGNEHQCVSLVRAVVPGMPRSSAWKEGDKISEESPPDLKPGTAIATFTNGRYGNKPHGNHAAIFLRYGEDKAGHKGIFVLDQYNGGGGQAKETFYPYKWFHGYRGHYYAGQFSSVRK